MNADCDIGFFWVALHSPERVQLFRRHDLLACHNQENGGRQAPVMRDATRELFRMIYLAIFFRVACTKQFSSRSNGFVRDDVLYIKSMITLLSKY
jgi:hypothetical protein